MKYCIIGGIVGFSLFVIGLESDKMGNIIFRNGYFRPSAIWQFVKHPFQSDFLWNNDLLEHNWIFMTGIGMLVGSIVDIVD